MQESVHLQQMMAPFNHAVIELAGATGITTVFARSDHLTQATGGCIPMDVGRNRSVTIPRQHSSAKARPH